MKKIILLVTTFCCFKTSYTQPGRLDSSFGNNGIVLTAIGAFKNPEYAIGRKVLTQADGTVYLIFETNYQTLIACFHADGTLNLSYGNNGYSKAVAIWGATGALQSDGKIVLAGTNGDFALTRFNTDGNLDTTFSLDGKENTDFESGNDIANSVAIRSDGKIVVAGSSRWNDEAYEDWTVARYNINGTLDTTFSKDGKLTKDFGSAYESANSVAIQGDGKIVVAGYTSNSDNFDFAIIRYNTEGTPDSKFF